MINIKNDMINIKNLDRIKIQIKKIAQKYSYLLNWIFDGQKP